MNSPDWLDDAACSGRSADLFFPSGVTYDAGRVDYAPALAICAECPVVQPCKADAIAHGDIVDGHTTHGQVVGGCGPAPAKSRAKGERRLCWLEGCHRWFTMRQGGGANMYCSKECASAARRISQSASRQRRRSA